MNNVKSISLDDDELPNPIGIASGDTKNKAMHYTPGYANESAVSELGLSHLTDGMDDGTVRKGGGRFHLSEGLTRFTQVLGGHGFSGSGNNRSLILAAVFGLLLTGAGAYMYLGEEYFSGLLSSLHDLGGEVAEESDDASHTTPDIAPKEAGSEAVPAPAPAAASDTRVVEEIPGNPYWKLPNPVPVAPDSLPAVSQQQSEAWRAGLNHPFAYQRMKTTQQLRTAKLDGAVSVLYEALSQGKFWTRMEALLGIAENGVAIDNESMRTAIGDARPDLVKNYFKRFRSDYTEATSHIMRQALRVVDERARFVILWNLGQHRGEVNDQYLYAASLNEPDASTREMVQGLLQAQPVPQAFVAAYEKALSEVAVVVTTPKRKPTDVIKADKIPANMNVEEVYFINDEAGEAAPTEAPVEVKKKEDDGFNDLQHTEDAPTEAKAP